MKAPKRIQNTRPANWTDIVEHYRAYKSVRSTMKMYHLAEMNANYQTWCVALCRWAKDIKDGKTEKKPGRSPVYGFEIDNQLAAVVKRYNLNGVPMTDHILKLTLMEILKTANRQDILERICPDNEDLTTISITPVYNHFI